MHSLVQQQWSCRDFAQVVMDLPRSPSRSDKSCLQGVSAFAENLRGWKFVKPYSRPESPEVMDELAWQRSAVEFLPEVVARGKNPARYASVLRDVANEAANFDAWCRAELVAGGVGEPQPPPLSAGYWWGSIDDVPEGHWWWRVTAAPGYGLEEDFWDGESDSALETSVSDSA